MSNYFFYKIFNLTEFNSLGLFSRTYSLELEDLGLSDILVTKGKLVSIVYEGVLLSLDMNSENPFMFDDFAIFKDSNEDVYLGLKKELYAS